MQDIMQRLGLPSDNAPVMDANQAAIALAMAMQKARAEIADREGVKEEARSFGTAKLESLRSRLAPLYSAIPRDAEFLELGHVSHDKPRLFVDILAFVEPTRDQTGYRLVQETRSGRMTLAETQNESGMVEAVTTYIARRLVDRERALAAEASPVMKAASPESTAPEKSEPLQLKETPAPAPEEPRTVVDSVRTIPLTAEQAFRQWTRSTGPEPVPATDVSMAAAALTAPAAIAGSMLVEAVNSAATTVSAPVAAAVTAETAPAISAAAKLMPVDMRSVSQAAVDPAPVSAAAPPATSAVKAQVTAAANNGITPVAHSAAKRSNGWWLWPLLALLIGAAIGAAALYLYAANLVR